MNYYPPPVLETKRLILRPITPEDAEAAFIWLSDERVNRFMPYNIYSNLDEVLHWINDLIPAHDGFQWGFALKGSNQLIGSGDIRPHKGNPDEWGFGYNIRYDFLQECAEYHPFEYMDYVSVCLLLASYISRPVFHLVRLQMQKQLLDS